MNRWGLDLEDEFAENTRCGTRSFKHIKASDCWETASAPIWLLLPLQIPDPPGENLLSRAWLGFVRIQVRPGSMENEAPFGLAESECALIRTVAISETCSQNWRDMEEVNERIRLFKRHQASRCKHKRCKHSRYCFQADASIRHRIKSILPRTNNIMKSIHILYWFLRIE